MKYLLRTATGCWIGVLVFSAFWDGGTNPWALKWLTGFALAAGFFTVLVILNFISGGKD